jgi:hypothetical protein
LKDIFQNSGIDIVFIEIPILKTFEYLIGMFFEKPYTVSQIKKEWGSNYKSGDCKKMITLFEKQKLEFLRNNLKRFKSTTNWNKLFSDDNK